MKTWSEWSPDPLDRVHGRLRSKVNTRAVGLSFLLIGATGCDKIHSLFGHPDPAPGGANATAEAGAPAAAPAATKTDDSLALSGFEGEIDVVAKSASNPTPVPINLLIKNDTVHVDVPSDLLNMKEARAITGGGKVYAILKVAEKKLYVVLDAKREAVAIDLDQMGDRVKSFRSAAPGAHGAPDTHVEPPKVVKTGKKEKIAGYECEDWDVLNADKSKLSACVADQGASFFHLPITGIPTEHVWALELADGKHFPLKGVAFGKDGAETGRVEVTKLDKRTLDASQFEVPPGYKEVSIEEMIQGLGAGPPGDLPHDVPKPGHGGHHGGHHHNKN